MHICKKFWDFSDSGKTSSITVSAISQGIVNIIDTRAQQSKTGTDSVTTVALLNRDVQVNDKGEAVDDGGNSTAHTIAPIFDKEMVSRETQAQMTITQAFSQQAPMALNTFATNKIKPYQEAIKALESAKVQLATETDPDRLEQLQNTIIQAEQTIAEAQADYDHWNPNGDYRIASNILIAAISGGSSGAANAITKESLSWAADQMRQAMIEDSKKFPGICVSENDCISNMSGKSAGVNGDNTKVAGGRIVLATWCEKGGGGACESDSSTKSGWKENADGTVIFKPKDENGNALTLGQFIEHHPEIISPLGGHQGGQGEMAIPGVQFDYAPGSFWDKLAEAYSGTHDTLNSIIWYDRLGNGKKLDGTLLGQIGATTNMTNVGIATPFALSVLLPPEVWSSIFTIINSRK